MIELYLKERDSTDNGVGRERIAFVGDVHFDTMTPASRIDDYMETCCKKIEAIGDRCRDRHVKYLFFAGDIFHRIQCSHECVNRAGQVLAGLKQKGVRAFSICGNHDLPRDNLNYLVKSPIETLFSFGVLEHIDLENPVSINGNLVKITACDFTQTPPPADKDYAINILLAHMFYEMGEIMGGPEQNISKETLMSLGYDVAFLGHDHEYHAPEVCGETMVIRPGSVLRGTSHNYNFTRRPCFVIFDIFEKTKDYFFKEEIIPHRPYTDVAARKILEKKEPLDRTAIQKLAERLARVEDEAAGEDTILQHIKDDPAIPANKKALLLDYISKFS